ncbi:MAG: hypothetical protein ABR910_12405 [Acidobacteriaceae bacterium]|jgi:predicted outer membrane protein
MFKLTNIARLTVAAAALVAVYILPAAASAQKDATPKQIVTVQQEQPAFGQNQVAQLVLLMNTNKDGRVTREQFIRFMDAQFDLLDTNKTGAVAVKEVIQPTPRVWYVASTFGK